MSLHAFQHDTCWYAFVFIVMAHSTPLLRARPCLFTVHKDPWDGGQPNRFGQSKQVLKSCHLICHDLLGGRLLAECKVVGVCSRTPPVATYGTCAIMFVANTNKVACAQLCGHWEKRLSRYWQNEIGKSCKARTCGCCTPSDLYTNGLCTAVPMET